MNARCKENFLMKISFFARIRTASMIRKRLCSKALFDQLFDFTTLQNLFTEHIILNFAEFMISRFDVPVHNVVEKFENNVAKQKTLCYTIIVASYREDTVWPSCDVVY